MIAWGPLAAGAAVPDDVHLVRIDLDAAVPLEAPLFDVLSDDERAAAARFLRPADALRFSAARAVLRRTLAAALDAPAASLRFRRSDRGRPSLCDAGAALDFNVSHSGDHALVAWSRRRRVGVDVEAVRPGWDWTSVARLVLGEGDAQRIAALADPDARSLLFYDVWVAKEALLKADGRGIGDALGAFSVAASDPRHPVVSGEGGAAADLGRFEARWLRDLPGHAACLAWSRSADGPG